MSLVFVGARRPLTLADCCEEPRSVRGGAASPVTLSDCIVDGGDAAGPDGGDEKLVEGGRNRNSEGLPEADPAEVLSKVHLDAGECFEGINRRSGEPCSSARVLKVVVDFASDAKSAGRADARGKPARAADPALLPSVPTAEAAAVRRAAATLGCDSESCVIGHPAVRDFAAKHPEHGLTPADLERELDLRFKPPGPRNSTALLNNFNIDGTLQRWARVFRRFYPCPFAMMDFEATQEPFASTPLPAVLSGAAPADLGPGIGRVRREHDTFGCVVNTDVSTGPGKHWVAVFVDARAAGTPEAPWTVEYFNSAGRPPPRPMVRWMEQTADALRAHLVALGKPPRVDTVAVTDLDHQESNTECGLYALYYIRCRLESVPITFFERKLVPDEAMTAFRRQCFRARQPR